MRLNTHELKCWYQEARAAHLYSVLSDIEAGTLRQLVFLELANEAREQAVLWAIEARKSGMVAPEYMPDRLVKVVTWLIKKCGARSLKPLLALMKLRGLAMFAHLPGRGATQQSHPVFATNDGLFALALLTIGVASAKASPAAILLIGVAGLLAGAIATAAGEYFSAKIQTPASPPNIEHQELTRIYQARGMSHQQAGVLAKRVMADPDAEDEVPEATGEETPPAPGIMVPPMQVALRAFFAFVVGGVVPLAPYLLDAQRHSLLIALVLSGVGIMLTGGIMSAVAGREPLWGAFRVLGVGILAGILSAVVGGLVGSFI